MGKDIKRHITHLKNGTGVKPSSGTSSPLLFGEIAVGYKEGEEALFIMNSTSGIAEFNPSAQILASAEVYTDNKINDLDAAITGTPGAGKTLTAFNQTNGKVTATFGNISITKNQVSDFPTIGDGTFTISGNGTSVASTSANATNNTGLNIKAGSNITITTGASEITIAGKAGTVTNISTASGITGGPITSTGTIGLEATGTAGTYGPTANVTGTEGTTIKVPQITTDAYGRVTSVTERTLTNKNTTYTAASSVTSVATAKTVGTSARYAREDHVHDISIATGDDKGQVKIAGTNVSVNGLGGAAYLDTGTTAGTVAAGNHTHANMVTGTGLTDNAIVLGGGSSAVKTSSKSIETTLSSTSDAKIPTSKAIATYISQQMASALTYKGSISSNDTLKPPYKTGDLWVVSSAGTYAGKACEVGDYLIAKNTVTAGTSVINADWDAINGENQVENKAAKLAWNSAVTIATVDGTNITAELPDNPNTDSATTLNGHYTPTSSTTIARNADSTTGASWGSSDFITGITLYKDAKGHITDMTVRSLQMPDNPDTNYYISGATTTTAASQFSVSLSGNNTAAKASFTILAATTTAAGVMTAADKTLLNALSGDVADLSGQSETIAAAINDLNDRKLDASAYTPTDLSNYYTKSETSGASQIQTALNGKSNTSHTHVSSAVTAMTGYAKASSVAAISTSDSLNVAIGKLEKALDGKQASGATTSAFTTVSVVGSSTVNVVADKAHDTITFEKDDAITLTGDVTNDKVTFGLGNIECGDYA